MTVVLAAFVAIVAAPLPPLHDAVKDEVWTRGIEFGLLTFAFLMLLAAVGLLRSKISLGLGGVSAERQAIDARVDAATVEIVDATRDLAGGCAN